MNPSRLINLTASLLVGLLPLATMALDEPQTLRLLGHSSLENVDVRLDEGDWQLAARAAHVGDGRVGARLRAL